MNYKQTKAAVKSTSLNSSNNVLILFNNYNALTNKLVRRNPFVNNIINYGGTHAR